MDAANPVELETAARELRDYILYKRSGKPINSSHDYEFFRRTVSRYNHILHDIKPKDLVTKFSSMLRLERSANIDWIYAVRPQTTSDKPSLGGTVSKISKSSKPFKLPTLTKEQQDQCFPQRAKKLPFNLLAGREELERSRFADRHGLTHKEFKWAYEFLAYHTARLFGIVATAPANVNMHTFRESILGVLKEHLEETMRQELGQVVVFTFLYKNEHRNPQALCFFTLLHLGSLEITEKLFRYLVDEVVPARRLRIGRLPNGNNDTIINNRYIV
ncbi:hypothetical protein EON65_46750 [archaeon]|nr:MAG: hypothetical protein EON65_46750 [archaeon]